jgi:hypothetical protein
MSSGPPFAKVPYLTHGNRDIRCVFLGYGSPVWYRSKHSVMPPPPLLLFAPHCFLLCCTPVL